jgi:hypothetical protein
MPPHKKGTVYFHAGDERNTRALLKIVKEYISKEKI